MNSERRSYREIMKGTAIFGGTQVLTMALAVVRGKLVALLLGAFGMGVSQLFNTALQPLQQAFAFGLPYASVSSIASVEGEERERRALALRRVTAALGFLGLVATVVLAKVLSWLTFSDLDHTTDFAVLGVAVMLTVMSGGETAIMQSFRRLRRMAMCNIAGAVAGLVVGVPLYWLYGVRGIVPAMVALAAVLWIATRWGSNGLTRNVRMTWRESLAVVRPIALLGLTMMIVGMLGNLMVWLINAFINACGTTADVGLYAAATLLTSQCTALVFTALSTDYYPHLSQVCGDRCRTRRLMSQEAEVALLVAAPASMALMTVAPVVVPLLLSGEFATIVPLVTLLAAVMVLRAFIFPLDYICVARGDRRYYFFYEGVLCNVKTFFFLTIGYSIDGLLTLGYAALLNAVVDAVLAVWLTRWRYGVMFRRRTMLLAALLLTVTIAAALAGVVITQPVARLVMLGLVTAVLGLYCLWQLRRRAK